MFPTVTLQYSHLSPAVSLYLKLNKCPTVWFLGTDCFGPRGCTAWLENDEATVNQRAVQTQSAVLCRGAAQISSPITDTITSDCSSHVCWSVSRRFLSPSPEPHLCPHDSERWDAFKVVSCFFFFCVFSFSVILFSLFFSPLLQVLFYCYYQMFLFFPHLFIIFFLSSRWQRRCFYRPAIKAATATAESEKDSAPMLFPVIYSYSPQKHTGFKPLNIQISRRPLCLSLLHSKILINCFVCGSSYYRPPYRLRRPRSLNKQEKVFRKCSQCGLFFCSAGGD